MVEISRHSPQQSDPKRPKRSWLMTAGKDGQLLAAPTSNTEPERIENPAAYLDSMLGRKKLSHEKAREELFWRFYNAFNCLHCQDRGVFMVEVQTDRGPYQFGFTCNCETGQKMPGACITDAIAVGAYSHFCQLWRNCHLKGKASKCYKTRCPKFDTDVIPETFSPEIEAMIDAFARRGSAQ